jgi:hypothetical protein
MCNQKVSSVLDCECGVTNHGEGMDSVRLDDGYASKEFRERLEEFAAEWLCRVAQSD